MINTNTEIQIIRCHVVVIISLQLILSVHKITSIIPPPNSPRNITCYDIECYGKCDKSLPVVGKNFKPPKKTIYFIETSCIGGLQSRAACSVESAARANPTWHILVLFAGPLKNKFKISHTFSKLKSLRNVHFYRLNTTEYARGTPIEYIFRRYILVNSRYPAVHASDFLRLLTLYKYGGLYLDLDMIVMKSFDSLPKNFIARQRERDVGSAIIAATKEGIGHKFLNISIRDVAADRNNYNPLSWAGVSNDLYTRSLQKICSKTDPSEMNAMNCQGFHVLDAEWFYPIDWADWKLYYGSIEGVTLPVKISEYTHHMWNSRGSRLLVHPNSYFVRIAKIYCPAIYNIYGHKFGQ